MKNAAHDTLPSSMTVNTSSADRLRVDTLPQWPVSSEQCPHGAKYKHRDQNLTVFQLSGYDLSVYKRDSGHVMSPCLLLWACKRQFHTIHVYYINTSNNHQSTNMLCKMCQNRPVGHTTSTPRPWLCMHGSGARYVVLTIAQLVH